MSQPLTGAMRALVWGILAAVAPWAILLGLFPRHTSVFWMWAMRDPRSAVLVGAVYIGAAIYYVLALRQDDWERTKSGLEGAFIVSAVLLIAVALHWATVRPYHIMTLVWLTAYYGPLVLIPILFRREENREGGPGDGPTLAMGWRRWLVLRGAFYLGLTVVGFIFAPVVARHWPWPIDALEVRMFLGQTATFVWASANVLRGNVLWPRYRLHLVYAATLGLVQFLGLGLISTPYQWESLFSVVLPVLFAEWIITPVLMFLTHEGRVKDRRQTMDASNRVQEEGPGWDPYVRYGVKVIGGTYLAIGILGFIPIDAVNPMQSAGVGTTYLLRHIAVNGLHNIIHIVLGVTGLLATRTASLSRLWGTAVGVTLNVLFAIGLAQAAVEGFPPDQSLLGLIALNSPAHTFHLATGAVALLLSLTRPDP